MSNRTVLVVGYKSTNDRTFDKDGELLGEVSNAEELNKLLSDLPHGYSLNYFRDRSDTKGLYIPGVYLYLDGTRD